MKTKKLSPEETAIAEGFGEMLKDHALGMHNSKKAKELRQWGNRRDICRYVQYLRVEKGAPIGSGDCGYYWAETASELKHSLLVLRAKGASLLQVCYSMTDSYYNMLEAEEVLRGGSCPHRR